MHSERTGLAAAVLLAALAGAAPEPARAQVPGGVIRIPDGPPGGVTTSPATLPGSGAPRPDGDRRGPGSGPVVPASSLLVTDLKVIEDPVRTDPRAGSSGVWSFRYLVENLAGRRDPAELVERWLEHWESDQLVNGEVARARPRIRDLVIGPWRAASGGGRLDLDRAPFKLLAIVNRLDLRVHGGAAVETAGEGRFVFGVLGPDGRPLVPPGAPGATGFTVIFEYELVARSLEELRTWAEDWAGLGRFPVGTRDYNAALEALTRRFTDRGRAPLKPNGSALNQLRTNEIALSAPWELREFRLDPVSGLLRQAPVAATPDTVRWNGTPELAALVNANQAALLAGSFVLGAGLEGPASLSGPFVPGDFPDFPSRTFVRTPLTPPGAPPVLDIPWSAAGIVSNDARHALALNTCGGCHRAETATPFVMVGFPANHRLPATLGGPAALAAFLTGEAIPDPVQPATTRLFADLERRRLDLEALLRSFRTGPGPLDEPNRPRFVH